MAIAKPHGAFRCRLPRAKGARPCLLFRVYSNMRGRANGGSTRTPWIYPPGFPWKSYAEFRAWALASGFSKARPSPDRPRPAEPYGPANVEWKTKSENYASSRGTGYYGAQPSGPEPPYINPECIGDAIPCASDGAGGCQACDRKFVPPEPPMDESAYDVPF